MVFALHIPPRLKVGALVYEVVRPTVVQAVDASKTEKAEKLDGNTDPEALTIQVLAGLPLRVEQLVFLHELLHSVEMFAVLQLSESQVERLAQALLMVFADNDLLWNDGEPIAMGQRGGC